MSDESTGLRFRVYLDGEQADEGWVYRGDDADDAVIARLSGLCREAAEEGRRWRVEVYDPDQPIGDDNPLRLGPDSFVHIATIRVVLGSRPSPYGHPN